MDLFLLHNRDRDYFKLSALELDWYFHICYWLYRDMRGVSFAYEIANASGYHLPFRGLWSVIQMTLIKYPK